MWIGLRIQSKPRLRTRLCESWCWLLEVFLRYTGFAPEFGLIYGVQLSM